MDYRSKYLKYKAKYLNLLGGMKPTKFNVKTNDGSNDNKGYFNQCLWLSILDYLNDVLGNNITLHEIRQIGSSNNTVINDEDKEFDSDEHIKALINVATTFELQIHFYSVFRNKDEQLVISDEPNWIVGNRYPNVVSIGFYGAHFQLITYIEDKKLYKDDMVKSEWALDTGLALGKTIDESKNKEYEKINHLLEITVNFKRVILDLEQKLQSNQLRLEELKNSFIIEPNKFNEETTIAMIKSLQEHQIFLEKQIVEIKDEIKNMNENLKIVDKELNTLISL